MSVSAEWQNTILKGIALSGSLAVGKTTMARRLSRDFGMHVMRTVVTRPIERDEHDELLKVESDEFVLKVRSGEIVMPLRFGGHWYGYLSKDWDLVRSSGGINYIFNVRPYVGLVLASVLPNVVPVWLTISEEERIRRIQVRGASRDLLPERTVGTDTRDESYRPLYAFVVDATDPEIALTTIKSVAQARGGVHAQDSL
jgi:guanylate kinase